MSNPTYEMVPLANGEHSVRDVANGETFHPVIGPQEEARQLYVQQLNLAERMAHPTTDPLVVWDVGLGIGANASAVLETGCAAQGAMHLISFDKTTEAGRFAARNADSLPFLAEWKEEMDQLLSSHHTQVVRGSSKIQWDLVLEDFPTWLEGASKRAIPSPHAILFDPYSPAKNAEMWTGSLFRKLYGYLDPSRPCALATYSRATHIRVGLLLAGFHVGRGQATGAKEETTIAANHPDLIKNPLDRVWLERSKASTSAEPLTESGYRQAPLSEESWARLQKHPQFV